MSRIIFISNVEPTGVDTGKKVMLSGIVKYAVGRVGEANVQYVLVGASLPPQRSFWLPQENVKVVGGLSTSQKVTKVASSIILRRGHSLQETLLFSKDVEAILKRVVETFAPAIIVYDTVRMARYRNALGGTGRRHVIYLEDLLSVRYDRMLDAMSRYPTLNFDPLGNFQKNIPAFAQVITRSRRLTNWILRREAKLIDVAERESAKKFDAIALVNAEELNVLQERMRGGICGHEVKPCFDDEGAFSRSEVRFNEFVFVGNLNLAHNDAGICHFIENLWPLALRVDGALRLRVIGRHPSVRLQQAAKAHPDTVSIEGFVDDLDNVLAQCCASIVPLFFGSGVKMKTLDAFRRGVPVVSTTTGVEGIPVEQNRDCFVEDGGDEFVARLLSLRDVSVNQAMSQASIGFFAKFYSRSVVHAGYGEFIFGDMKLGVLAKSSDESGHQTVSK